MSYQTDVKARYPSLAGELVSQISQQGARLTFPHVGIALSVMDSVPVQWTAGLWEETAIWHFAYAAHNGHGWKKHYRVCHDDVLVDNFISLMGEALANPAFTLKLDGVNISPKEKARLSGIASRHAWSLGATAGQVESILHHLWQDIFPHMVDCICLELNTASAEERFLKFINVTIPQKIGHPPTNWGQDIREPSNPFIIDPLNIRIPVRDSLLEW